MADDSPSQPSPDRAARARISEWEYIDARELPVRLRIPFASEWRRRETKTSLRLDLPREQVQVLVRFWQTSRLASEEQCLTELSLVEPAFAATRDRAKALSCCSERSVANSAADPSGTVATQTFDPSSNFHGHLRAEVASATAGDALRASVVGIATNSGRCLVFVATTDAKGPTAQQQLGERLEWIVDGMAKSLSVRTSDGRVQKPPHPVR